MFTRNPIFKSCSRSDFSILAGNQSSKANSIKLESVDRIINLPIVESGWNYAGQVYGSLKQSNNVLHWAFGQAESSLNLALSATLPVASLFKGPILTLDKIVCYSLDNVEERVPSIRLPTEQIYSNTKQYIHDVGNTVVRPILKRADSVKQITDTVLDSKYTAFAANKLEGALDVADKYVDKYLPADETDAVIEENDASKAAQDNNLKSTYKTIHHMDRLSRKLQRRLTRLTLAEAKVLKEHSTEAIHVLAYAIEVIATDPKLAHQKVHEIWASLSIDEPENQAPPQNLEELVVLLTRESARRFVHLVNFTHAAVNAVPKQLTTLTHKCQHGVEDLIRNVQTGNMNQIIIKGAKIQAHKFTLLLRQLNLYSAELLEVLANSLEEYEQNIKSLPPTSNQVPSSNRFRTHISSSHTHRSSNKHNNIVNGADNART